MSDCPCYILATSLSSQTGNIHSSLIQCSNIRMVPKQKYQLKKKKKLQDCAVSFFLCEFLSLGRPRSAFSEIWQVAVLMWQSAAGFSKETKSEQDSENKQKKKGSRTVDLTLSLSSACSGRAVDASGLPTAGVLPTASLLNWFGCHMVTTWLYQGIKQWF